MSIIRTLLGVPAALVLATGLLVSGPGTAQATAPVDPPTEFAKPVRVVLAASDYASAQSQRCRYQVSGDAVDVDCSRTGLVWLDYEFDVPRTAINLRTQVRHQVADGSAGDYVNVEAFRKDDTSYSVAVNVARGTEVQVSSVRLRYDLPTQVDDQACVTPGEWQAIDVAKGGTGGSKSRVATVFDHRGIQKERSEWSAGYRYQVRAYPRCDSDRLVRVTFHQYRDQPGWHSYWG